MPMIFVPCRANILPIICPDSTLVRHALSRVTYDYFTTSDRDEAVLLIYRHQDDGQHHEYRYWPKIFEK